MIRQLTKWMSAALMLATSLTASAHIGYGGRDFGTLDPSGTASKTITGQSIGTLFGWADGTDSDWGDSHRLRPFKFHLNSPGYVTITFTATGTSTNGQGALLPGFSVYAGLGRTPSSGPPVVTADHDFSVISQSFLATQVGYKEACFNALGDWKIGSDEGTTFADLDSFTFYGYAVDGTSANFGSNPSVVGDGNADGTVTGTFYLPAGDFTIMAGGAKYSAQPTPSSVYLDPSAPSDTTRRSYTDTYGVTGTVSVSATNPASVVAFSSATVNVALDATTAYVTLTRPVGGPAFSVSLSAVDGNAIAGTHYTAPTAPVHFAVSETSRTVAIPLTAQTGIRPDRSFTLNLGTPTNGVALGTQTSTVVTIAGNDSGGVLSFGATTATTTQGATSVSVTVNRTASLVPATVALTTIDGTAVAGTDFAAPTATVDFAANETTKTVPITLIPRTGVQPARSFTVGLGATTGNATIGSPSSLTVTINPLGGSGLTPVITNGDPGGDGITYAWTVQAGPNDSGTIKDHVGAWSWEDNSLFAPGEPAVGWTHTSRWLALNLTKATVLTVTMARDATVPLASGPGGFADTTSMYPSFTLWKNWDNDGSDDHTYNNKGNVAWAEDLVYLDHVDNSTETTITRSWVLPAGDYTFVLGSNAPATNTNRQGFSFTFSTSETAAVDLVPNVVGPPAQGGIGYARTIVANAGDNGSFKSHVGAWSWEDNSLFAPGQPAVGWTHTSNWVAINVPEDSLFTVTMNSDATVPWPSQTDPNRLADTTSMFPSFTLWKGIDNDGGDFHTYNNKGRVAWAEDLTYVDHLDNSTESSVTRTWFLKAGNYTMALGSNAPATNPLRQGYNFAWSAAAATTGVNPIDPGADGIGYAYTIIAGAGDSGSFKTHVGAWSWEDNSLFAPGEPAVGWTHTSKWVALDLRDTVTFSITMARDATVPWVSPSNPDPNQLADTSSMFPSFTLWRNWDTDGGDSHTYNNKGNVDWAEDLSYIDHIDNSTQSSVTRSWTLPAGHYTFALGSNAPATNALRQGFSFSYSTSAAVFVAPIITKQPLGAALLANKIASLSVTATGPGLTYQWFKDGVKIDAATESTYTIASAQVTHSGAYTVEVRNAAGWVTSNPAILGVTGKPVVNSVTLPSPIYVGQPVNVTVTATNAPTAFSMTGKLPTGVAFNAKTGAITGRAQQTGSFDVSFKASNKAGTSDTAAPASMTVTALISGTAGEFNGIIERSPFMNDLLGGSVKINATAVGGFTGSLVMGTKSYPLAGTLNTALAAPTGAQSITRAGQTPLLLNFTITPTNRIAVGSIADGAQSLAFTALQSETSPADYVGNQTLALVLDAGDQGDAAIPQGHSYGAFSLSATGSASGVIVLADETKVTFTSALQQSGSLSLFKPLYTNLGSLLAVLHIDKTASNNLSASEVSWYKKPEATTSKGRVYKDGFGPLLLTTIGSKYVAPATATTLAPWLTAGTNNAKLTFAEGGAPTPATRLDTAKVTIVAGSPKPATIDNAFNPGKATLKLTPGAGTAFVVGTTGSFTGTFKLTDTDTTTSKPLDRSVTFNGIIVNDGTVTKGYGTFLLPEMPVAGPPKTTLLTSKKLSGSVLLEAQAIVQ